MATQAPWQTSPFLGLSTEVQLMILHHLLPSIESIHAASKTCKHIHDVALHLSVHTFRNLGIQRSRREHEEWNGARTMKFIRYVTITKPELAQHVKCVTLGRLEPDAWDSLDKSRAPQGEELDLYRGLIEKTITEDDCVQWKRWRIEWLEGLANCVEDAEAALLLVACPNIESILVGEPEDPRRFLRVLEVAANRSLANSNPDTATGTQCPLQRLKEVYLESEETKYGNLSWPDYAKVFHMQSLRSFEVVRASGEDYCSKAFEALPKKSSNVEEIILRTSCITAKVLHAVTAIPKGLRAFEYTRGVYHMYDEEMMPGDVVHAMLPHAETLEDLHLNSEDDWPTNGATETLAMGLGLKKLTALKRLAAGMMALTGTRNPYPADHENMNFRDVPVSVDDAPRMVDCLPENLEYLQIHYCGKAVLPHAQELLNAQAAGRFPKLSRVRLLFNKELISPVDIDLHFDPSAVRVEICLQSEENRCYDLIQRVGSSCAAACTRIYAEDVRDKWLRLRCRDVARAEVNDGVLFEPEL